MNYIKIEKHSIANGEGIRVVLWVSGCRCHCKNCQNPETWSFKSGKIFDVSAKEELFESLNKTYIQGITFSGGHPLEHENISTVYSLCKEIKEKFPQKDIWLYTGFKWEKIKNLEIMNYLDIVVDGKYVEEEKDISLIFRGSKNQRIIDVRKSLLLDSVVLW